MTPVSEFSALTFDNLYLRLQVVQSQIRELQLAEQQIQRDGLAHVEDMRAAVGADPKAEYNPQTKTFVLAVTPLKTTRRRQAKRARG